MERMTDTSTRSSLWQASLAALVAAGCLLAIGWPMFSSARASILSSTQSEVLQLARAAAALVDLDALAQVRDPADAGGPAHLRLLTPLVQLHRAVRDIMYVYVAVEREGRIHFQAGTDALYRVAEDALPPDPIMSPYPGSDPQLRQALQQQVETVNPAPIHEARRSYLSAYVPLFDASGGFHGVLGVDMWARKLDARLEQLDRSSAWALLLAVLLSTAAGLLRFRQHRARRQAHEIAERTRIITDHVPVLIAYIDREERYRFCNGAFRELLGIAPEQVLGRTVREIRGEKVYRLALPHIAKALKGERASFAGFSDTGNVPFHFHSEYIPDVAEGEVRGFFAMTVDCSAIHDAEQKSAAAERTDALHQLLSQLAASFSNQLTTVHGYLESIDTDAVTPSDLEVTRLSLEDCLRTVEQVQLLAGYSSARFDVIPLAALAEDIQLQWRQNAHAVPLEVQVGFELPMIRGNTLLLRTALIEILENAHEAMASPPGAIVLRATKVTDSPGLPGMPLVESAITGNSLLIEVVDQGAGMDEAVLRRACDPYFSTKPGRKGLGLSLVAGIVRVHGGRLRVDSRPGQGTTVTLELPAP